MKTIISFIFGALLGVGSFYLYSVDKQIQQQVAIANVQGKVDAALTLCPAAFKNVVQEKK